jgi:hypothetical protein
MILTIQSICHVSKDDSGADCDVDDNGMLITY